MGKAVVNTMNELIAAIPSMLGYPPIDRVAIAFLADRQVQMVAAAPVRGFPAELDVLATATRHGYDRIIVIAATDEPMARVRIIVDDIERQARDGGLSMVHAVHLSEYAMGARYVDVRTGAVDLLDDPQASVVAAVQVMQGRRFHPNRAEIEARFAVTAEADPMPATAEPIEVFAARTLTELVDAVMLGERVAPELAARVGWLVVRSRTARDAVIGVGAVGLAQAAVVMVDIANQLRGRMRVEVLTVAAVLLYAAADGVAAGVAIVTAFDSARASGVEVPPLLSLLDQALSQAGDPKMIRRLVDTGVVVADDSYRVFIPEV